MRRTKSFKVEREFRRHKIDIIKRINRRFISLERYKRLLMIMQSENGPFSRLELIAGIMPQYTDPRTGLMTLKGKTYFEQMVRKLNQNGYAEKYPFVKVYSLPFVDEEENEEAESTFAVARYYLILIYGKSISEVISRIEKVIDGLNNSINRLNDVKAVGARKVKRELEKYKQQIEFEAAMTRQKKRFGQGSGAGIS